MDDLGSELDDVNVQGEAVKRLDVLSNETMVHFLVLSLSLHSHELPVW